MASINKVIIVGNLGNEPEVRRLPSGDSVANISVATTDRYKDKQTGENKEITEWHRISFFGRTAEVVGQYLHKGSQVYVEGSIRTRKWQDQSGQTRYATEIRGDVMQMLGGKSANAESAYQSNPAASGGYNAAPSTNAQAPIAPNYGGNAPQNNPIQPAAPSTSFTDIDDDIPF